MTAETIHPNFTPLQVETIKNTTGKGLNETELQEFLHLAAKHNLDPIAEEIWYVRSEATPVYLTDRHGCYKIASALETFAGIRSGAIYEGDDFTQHPDGTFEHSYSTEALNKIVAAYAIVYRRDRMIPYSYYLPIDYKLFTPERAINLVEAMALKRSFSINGIAIKEEFDSLFDAHPLPPSEPEPDTDATTVQMQSLEAESGPKQVPIEDPATEKQITLIKSLIESSAFTDQERESTRKKLAEGISISLADTYIKNLTNETKKRRGAAA